jgi:hypothetical protein
MLAGIALAIYANRIDWLGVVAGSQRQENYPSKKDLESKQQAAALGTARYDEAKTELEALERRRPRDTERYAKALEPLESSQDSVPDIVRQARTGVPILSPDGLPTFKPSNPPLQCRQDYQRKIADVEDSIAKTIQETKHTIEEEQKRTEELNGTGQQPGLRDLLREERVAKEKAVAELRYLQPLRYNFQVESVLLDKRRRSLQERLQELDRLGMAFQRP